MATSSEPASAVPRRVLPGQWRRAAALILLLAVLFLDGWGTWRLAQAAGPFTDLFPRWYGTRAWVQDGQNIYSPQVSAGIFEAMRGRPPQRDAGTDELADFAFGFTYPPYVAALLVPLALLPLPVAVTVWLLIGQIALLASCWLLSRFPGSDTAWARPALAQRRFRWLVLVALLWPPVLANIVFGQFAVVVLAILVSVRSLLLANRPLAAGVCLSAAIVKPQLAIVVLPLVLAAAWRRPGYQRLWLGCAAGLALLLAISFAVAPNWIEALWQSVRRYDRAVTPTSAVGLLLGMAAPGLRESILAPILELGVVALAAAAALRMTWARRERTLTPVAAVIAIGTCATLLAVPPLYEWNSVILLIPLAESLYAVERRLVGTGRSFWPVLALVVGCSLATIPLVLAHPDESRVVWPVVITTGWLATRPLAAAR